MNIFVQEILLPRFYDLCTLYWCRQYYFPPIVAQQAGEHVWLAAFGFLITAVGLPVITIMAFSYARLH
jgi:LIVCS family branched-chain amino acid:cation transporter